MNYLINEKIIEQIVDKDYFCLFDFQMIDITIKLYQLFEYLTMMNDDQINILISIDKFLFHYTNKQSRTKEKTDKKNRR